MDQWLKYLRAKIMHFLGENMGVELYELGAGSGISV